MQCHRCWASGGRQRVIEVGPHPPRTPEEGGEPHVAFVAGVPRRLNIPAAVHVSCSITKGPVQAPQALRLRGRAHGSSSPMAGLRVCVLRVSLRGEARKGWGWAGSLLLSKQVAAVGVRPERQERRQWLERWYGQLAVVQRGARGHEARNP